jgi:DNA-damage-inducible protein J
MRATIAQVRIDKQTKNQAQTILKAHGITISEAVRLFLCYVVQYKNLPFEINKPNTLTKRTLKTSEKRNNLHKAYDIEQF